MGFHMFLLWEDQVSQFPFDLISFYSLGQVENARCHLCFPGQQPDQAELQKLHSLEKYLNRCTDARKIGDWKSALRECNAAIATGADCSPQVKPSS